MKKLMNRTLAVGIFLLAMAVANAADLPTIRITTTGADKKFSLVIEKPTYEMNVQLKYPNGGILVERTIAAGESFGKIFNLQNLEPGQYELAISSGTREVIQPVSVTATDIVLNESLRKTVYLPIINAADTHVDVNFFNEQKVAVNVAILNDEGDLVFADHLTDRLAIERRYNLAQLPKGNYILKVALPDRTFFRNLEIK